jgi:hypothetical protein
MSIPAEKNKDNNSEFKASASYTSNFDNIDAIVDGKADRNGRWTAFESPNTTDWVQVDFNQEKTINTAYIYFYEDNTNIFPPKQVTMQFWDGSSWNNVTNQRAVPEIILGNSLNIAMFNDITTNKIRVLMEHKPGKYSGIYEVEVYKK